MLLQSEIFGRFPDQVCSIPQAGLKPTKKAVHSTPDNQANRLCAILLRNNIFRSHKFICLKFSRLSNMAQRPNDDTRYKIQFDAINEENENCEIPNSLGRKCPLKEMSKYQCGIAELDYEIPELEGNKNYLNSFVPWYPSITSLIFLFFFK